MGKNLNANLSIDGDRLWKSLENMAEIGPGVAGGNNRQALTREDAEGREQFARWCHEEGMTLEVDQMGTMFATRAGTDPDLLPIGTGSHLDTQPNGGRYDGVLGVLGGLEVVRTLNSRDIKTKRPITVINWSNEEGTRFSPAMLASGVFAGVHALGWAYGRTDSNGISYEQALIENKCGGDKLVGAFKLGAYFELHIEQGPILEMENKSIGVVTHCQGLRWLKVSVTGIESHSGSTPMYLRKSAGLGAAQMTVLAQEIAYRFAPHAMASVGTCELMPNSINTVPGRADFTVDFRHRDLEALEKIADNFELNCKEIASEAGLEVTIEQIGAFDPVTFDKDCVDQVRTATKRLGVTHMDLVSGAGHDACWVNKVAPSAMIMCPCEGGLSHNEAEAISPEWATAGSNVLLHTILDAAGAEAP